MGVVRKPGVVHFSLFKGKVFTFHESRSWKGTNLMAVCGQSTGEMNLMGKGKSSFGLQMQLFFAFVSCILNVRMLLASNASHAEASPSGFQVLPEPIKGMFDTNRYKAVRLANGMLVVAIQQKDLLDSRLSVCLNSGLLQDTKAMQGASHFMRYLPYLPTESYPEDLQFEKFIRLNYGNVAIANTFECDALRFRIANILFDEALDRIASCFSRPIMQSSLVVQEKLLETIKHGSKNISPEMISSKICAKYADKEHPYFKRENEQVESLDKMDEVKHFYTNHFSAHLFSVVIMGTENVDVLVEKINQRFQNLPISQSQTARVLQSGPEKSEINSENLVQTKIKSKKQSSSKGPQRNVPKNSNQLTEACLSQRELPFSSHQLGSIIYISSPEMKSTIEFMWQLPISSSDARLGPAKYLSFIMDSENNAPIFLFLKENKLATALKCIFTPHSKFSLFRVVVSLTEEGKRKYLTVGENVFSYLRTIKNFQIRNQFLEEIQKMEMTTFNCNEIRNLDTFVTELSFATQLWPIEQALQGRFMLDSNAVEITKKFLAELTVEKVQIIVSGNQCKSNAEMIYDELYNVSYTSQKITPSMLKILRRINPQTRFKLTLFENAVPQMKSDVKSIDNQALLEKSPTTAIINNALWYSKCFLSSNPISRISFLIQFPTVLGADFKGEYMALILTSLFSFYWQQFVEKMYSKCHFISCTSSAEGLDFHFMGPSMEVFEFSKVALVDFLNFIPDEESFKMYLERYRNRLKVFNALSSFENMSNMIEHRLFSSVYSVEEIHRVSGTITYSDMKYFLAQLSSEEFGLKVLVMGVHERQELISYLKDIWNVLKTCRNENFKSSVDRSLIVKEINETIECINSLKLSNTAIIKQIDRLQDMLVPANNQNNSSFLQEIQNLSKPGDKINSLTITDQNTSEVERVIDENEDEKIIEKEDEKIIENEVEEKIIKNRPTSNTSDLNKVPNKISDTKETIKKMLKMQDNAAIYSNVELPKALEIVNDSRVNISALVSFETQTMLKEYAGHELPLSLHHEEQEATVGFFIHCSTYDTKTMLLLQLYEQCFGKKFLQLKKMIQCEEKQLSMKVHEKFNNIGLMIKASSKKKSCLYMEMLIGNFFESSYEHVKKNSDFNLNFPSQLQKLKNNLKQEKDTHPISVYKEDWKQILFGSLDFDRREREIEMVDSITLQDFASFIIEFLFLDAKKGKVISIWAFNPKCVIPDNLKSFGILKNRRLINK